MPAEGAAVTGADATVALAGGEGAVAAPAVLVAATAGEGAGGKLAAASRFVFTSTP